MTEAPEGLVDCPALDCEYQGSWNQVKGHWGGSQDGEHKGKFHEAYEAYNEARESSEEAQARAGAVEGNSSPSEAVEAEPTQDPEPAESTQQTASSGGGLSLSGPPEPDPEPSASPEPPAEEDGEYVCPACEAPTGQDRAWFERVDVWQCDECGKKWRGVP